MSVRLGECEQRERANARRIEKLEQRQEDLNKLVTAVEVLAQRERSVESDVKEIKADVKSMTQKGARRWDAMIDKLLYALAGRGGLDRAGGADGLRNGRREECIWKR